MQHLACKTCLYFSSLDASQSYTQPDTEANQGDKVSLIFFNTANMFSEKSAQVIVGITLVFHLFK